MKAPELGPELLEGCGYVHRCEALGLAVVLEFVGEVYDEAVAVLPEGGFEWRFVAGAEAGEQGADALR